MGSTSASVPTKEAAATAEEEEEQKPKQPHAVLIALPGQGPVNPMVKLASLLHSRGFHITFVTCQIFHDAVALSRGPGAFPSSSSFRFATIPDGLCLDSSVTPAHICSLPQAWPAPFRALILQLVNDVSTPPVSCIIIDGTMTCTVEVAQEVGIPVAVFWPMSAAALVGFIHFQVLEERGLVPVDDDLLQSPVDSMPAMKGIRYKDLPSFIRSATNPVHVPMFDFLKVEAQRTSKAPALIINTFDELERGAIDALSSLVTVPLNRIYAIGPLPLLSLAQSFSCPVSSSSFLDLSLWEDDGSWIQWLESKPPASVIYVSYGSVTKLTTPQLMEFAWGLANSGHNFLWVLRPDLVDDPQGFLPEEFLAEIKGKGMITRWCLQEKVLSHPSVAVFLTHNGWNSTLESISRGIPMICWPFFADQTTNCHYACEEWGIGVELSNDVKREEVESVVREVMGGEKGRLMKERALEWKESALAAVKVGGGRSSCNFERLIAEVLIPENCRV